MRNPFHREKEPTEKAQEPLTLAENPLMKEGKLGALIAIPVLTFLMALIIVAKTVIMTQEFFMMLMGVGLVFWLMMLIVYYSLSKQQAISYVLYDREFGFTSRLHPRFEVYCQPEGVQTLIEKGDKIKNFDDFKARLKKYGLDDVADKFDKTTFPKYLHYFPHIHEFNGWDKDSHEVLPFKAHLVFTDKPHKEQFVFGAGQENWWGAILYNHTHAESDNVKVLGWGIDPFTSLPIPICVLLHSSLEYDTGKQAEDELKTVDSYRMVIANQHNIIDTLTSGLANVKKLLTGKFDKFDNLITMAQSIADTDIQFFTRVMKDRNPHKWKSMGKYLLYAITVAGIIALVAVVLHWLGVIVIPFLD